MKTLKPVVSIFILMLLSTSMLLAQYPCDSVRYFQEGLYNVKRTNGVHFGDNTPVGIGSDGSLDMDVYEPEGDSAVIRPVIVLAFGGSFVTGIRQSPDIVELCNRYTSMGYVCVSIDYRVGFFYPIDSSTTFKAVLRAVHDMKAAIRYLHMDVIENGNTWRIDTNRIVIGGVSAGAITAVQTAYLNSTQELISGFPWIDTTDLNAEGGMEGNSGNAGYSSNIQGVINLCGTIGDTLWIESANDPPIVSMHGDNDGTVPIGSGYIEVTGNYTGLYVHGSASMKVRSDNIGHTHEFYLWHGAGHTPFIETGGSNIGQIVDTYMDTTVWFTRDFLYNDIVCKNNIPQTIQDHPYDSTPLSIYPNPTAGSFTIDLHNLPEQVYRVRVLNVIGEEIVSKSELHRGRVAINLDDQLSGYYFVEIAAENTGEVLTVRTIVVQ